MMYSFLEGCSYIGRPCQAGDLSVDSEEIFTEKKDTWCYVSMCKTPHTALPWVNKSSKHFDNLALRHFVKATDVLKTQAHTRYCWLPYSTDSCDLDLFHDKYQWEIWKSTAWKLFNTAPTHLTAKKDNAALPPPPAHLGILLSLFWSVGLRTHNPPHHEVLSRTICREISVIFLESLKKWSDLTSPFIYYMFNGISGCF